jgi:hypothetical protein
MSRAKLRRLKRATLIQGEMTLQVHGWLPDLQVEDGDASLAGRKASMRGANPSIAAKREISSAATDSSPAAPAATPRKRASAP